MTRRNYTILDHIITQFDRGLQATRDNLTGKRPYPAKDKAASTLSTQQQKHSAGLMRVNHSGEICAQALYNAQALVAKDPHLRAVLQQAAAEETDHLAWTLERLQELCSRPSYLGLFWYWNSFLIGLVAGLASDSLSLGFLEETEIQVGRHLQGHLDQLATIDERSAAVIRQMQTDEEAHAHQAHENGARELPKRIKMAMTLQALVMTKVAYWI